MEKKIILFPHDESWANAYKEEVSCIQDLFKENFLTGYHIGSTSIPTLIAKPTIDCLITVKNIMQVEAYHDRMIELGYEAKGEYGIPFRRYFRKQGMMRCYHVHMYEQGDPHIDRCLLFRNYLCTHLKAKAAYARLKVMLSKRYQHDPYAYFCGKEAFIQKIIKKSGFNDALLVQVATPLEWKQYHRICKKQGDYTSYSSELASLPYKSVALVEGIQFIGAAQLHILEQKQALLKFLIIDVPYQHQHQHQKYEDKFRQLIAKWLYQQGVGAFLVIPFSTTLYLTFRT